MWLWMSIPCPVRFNKTRQVLDKSPTLIIIIEKPDQDIYTARKAKLWRVVDRTEALSSLMEEIDKC